MKSRFFKIGYISLALALLGFIFMEIKHRSENTSANQMSRAFQSAGLETARILNGGSSGGSFTPTFEDDIRGRFMRYPIALILLSGAFFLAGYLVGDTPSKEEIGNQ
jgi:hypothetical protein